MKRLTYLASLFFLFSILISCTEEIDSEWQLKRKIEIENFSPVGISAFLQFVGISDSSRNLIYLIDTTDLSIFREIKVENPVYMNIRKRKMLIPSYSMDTVYIYRGEEKLIYLESFGILDGPVAADAESIWYYAHVSHNDHLVHYKEGGYEHILGGKGSDSGQLLNPSNVMIIDSSVYVVDSGNKRIQVYDKNGEFDFSFGEELGLNWPTGIAASETNVFISDAPLNEIFVFDKQGKYQYSINHGIDGPSDLEYHLGTLYVANLQGPQISVFITKTKETK